MYMRYTPTSSVSEIYNKGEFQLMSADDISFILGDFVNNLKQYSPTRKLCNEYSNRSIVEFAFDCLNQFFFPARIRQDIPGDFKLQFLSRWITIMMTLPLQQQFIDNYRNVCMESYIKGYNYVITILRGGSQSNIQIKLCNSVFGHTSQESSPIVKFVRGYSIIVLSLSKDIILMFNPFHKKLTDEFPGFTTTQWITNGDIMISWQVSKIRKMLTDLSKQI